MYDCSKDIIKSTWISHARFPCIAMPAGYAKSGADTQGRSLQTDLFAIRI